MTRKEEYERKTMAWTKVAMFYGTIYVIIFSMTGLEEGTHPMLMIMAAVSAIIALMSCTSIIVYGLLAEGLGL